MNPADGNGVVTCLVEMRLDPGEADRATRLLRSVVESIEAKVGCQKCSISWDVMEADRICYCEIWTSESVFRAHVRSEEFQHVLVAMDMCREKPTVTIGARSGCSGIKYLKELRCDPDLTLGPGSWQE